MENIIDEPKNTKQKILPIKKDEKFSLYSNEPTTSDYKVCDKFLHNSSGNSELLIDFSNSNTEKPAENFIENIKKEPVNFSEQKDFLNENNINLNNTNNLGIKKFDDIINLIKINQIKNNLVNDKRFFITKDFHTGYFGNPVYNQLIQMNSNRNFFSQQNMSEFIINENNFFYINSLNNSLNSNFSEEKIQNFWNTNLFSNKFSNINTILNKNNHNNILEMNNFQTTLKNNDNLFNICPLTDNNSNICKDANINYIINLLRNSN